MGRPIRPTTLRGRNTQYSGRGFSDQHFAANATSADEFETWVAKVRQSSLALDGAAYEALAKPSAKVAPTFYSAVAPNLFETILAKYRSKIPHADHSAHMQPAGQN